MTALFSCTLAWAMMEMHFREIWCFVCYTCPNKYSRGPTCHFKMFLRANQNMLIGWAKGLTSSYVFIFASRLSFSSQSFLGELSMDRMSWSTVGGWANRGQSREFCMVIHFSQVRLMLALHKLPQCRKQRGCALAKWMKPRRCINLQRAFIFSA